MKQDVDRCLNGKQSTLNSELIELLNRYTQPCARDWDCDHSQCPLLRELWGISIANTLTDSAMYRSANHYSTSRIPKDTQLTLAVIRGRLAKIDPNVSDYDGEIYAGDLHALLSIIDTLQAEIERQAAFAKANHRECDKRDVVVANMKAELIKRVRAWGDFYKSQAVYVAQDGDSAVRMRLQQADAVNEILHDLEAAELTQDTKSGVSPAFSVGAVAGSLPHQTSSESFPSPSVSEAEDKNSVSPKPKALSHSSVVVLGDSSESADPAWSKSVPRNGDFYQAGWYFQRRLSNYAVTVVEINAHGYIWHGDKPTTEYVVERARTGDYEWLGPITPENIIQPSTSDVLGNPDRGMSVRSQPKSESVHQPDVQVAAPPWGVKEIRDRLTLHQDAQPDRDDVDFLLSVIDRLAASPVQPEVSKALEELREIPFHVEILQLIQLTDETDFTRGFNGRTLAEAIAKVREWKGEVSKEQDNE